MQAGSLQRGQSKRRISQLLQLIIMAFPRYHIDEMLLAGVLNQSRHSLVLDDSAGAILVPHHLLVPPGSGSGITAPQYTLWAEYLNSSHLIPLYALEIFIQSVRPGIIID